MDFLPRVRKLIEELNVNGIRYCHWKSNAALAESLLGQTDIDLLVHRKDAALFRIVLGQLCFRPAFTLDAEAFPSMEHYYALDDRSGVLVHVHAYYRVITGESLTKNYHLPLEELLLENTEEIDIVRVPTRSIELMVFAIRMMLKHTSLIELSLLKRYWQQVQLEIRWLKQGDSLDETLNYVACELPAVDTALISECVAALEAPAPLSRRILLGRRLRAQLKPYRRHSAARAWLSGTNKFAVMALRRLAGSKLGMIPQSGGAVIAFVGSEATGKSTLLAETKGWLGEHFMVEQIHAGKPKSTPLTAIPNLLVPALRAALPARRSTQVEIQYTSEEGHNEAWSDFPLLFGIRALLLAHDRRSLLTRAYSRAADGRVVLCDRYPSRLSGFPDGPQLSHLTMQGKSSVRRWLVETEAKLYREIPPPDLIIYLTAPLDVTIGRNASRGKKEPEDYVRRRHDRSSNLEFGATPVRRINTDQPIDQTILEVKKDVWNAL